MVSSLRGDKYQRNGGLKSPWSVSRRCGAVWLCLALLIAQGVGAETITISGTAFRVEAVSAVSADEVTVRLGGKETLIRRAELDDFVVRGTLASPELASRLSDRALVRFAETALALNPAWTGFAIRAIRARFPGDDPDLVEVVTALREDPARVGALREAAKVMLEPVLEPSAQPRATSMLLFELGIVEPNWLAAHAVEYTRALEKPFKSLSLAEGREALRLRDLERATDVVTLLARIFGQTDPAASEGARLLERVQAVLRARERGDLDALAEATNPNPTDDATTELVVPAALEGLHAAAAQAIGATDVETALGILARINPEVRTESTHELTRTALERIAGPESVAFVQPKVLDFIDVIAAHDPRVEAEYGRALGAQIETHFDRGALAEAEVLAERLSRLQGIDRSVTDRVLLRFARLHLGRGEFELAEQKLDRLVGGGLSGSFISLRLAVLRLSSGQFMLLIAGIVALGGAIIVGLTRARPRDTQVGEPEPSAAATESGLGPQRRGEAAVEHEPLQDFVVAEHRRMSPSAQEYQRCLEELGLPVTADLRAIKNAYRRLVKSVHPDANQTHDETAATRFIELTRVYDRILELRRDFGYDD